VQYEFKIIMIAIGVGV